MTKSSPTHIICVSILLASLSTSSADTSFLRRVNEEPTTGCSLENCSNYDSFSDLVLDLKTILSDGPDSLTHHLCSCPKDYSPDNLSFGGALPLPTPNSTTPATTPDGGVDTCGNATEGSTIFIPINSDLHVTCADGPRCFMGCPDMIFKVEGNLTLNNFTMGGGIVWDRKSDSPIDSRIEVSATGSLLMQDSAIYSTHTTEKGGAISNLGGSVVIMNGMLWGCSAAKEGGAIYSEGFLEVHNSMVKSSQSGVAGGGLFAGAKSTTVLNDVRFNYNEAPESSDIHLEIGASLEGCGELLDQSSTLKNITGETVAVIEPCDSSASGSPVIKAISALFMLSVLPLALSIIL